MRGRIVWTLLLLPALAGCLVGDEGGSDTGDDAAGDALRFIAIGDQGTGGPEQAHVADAMETVCRQRGCDLVLAMGDNIYEQGVADEYDEQFETKFEEPYRNFTIPFWMALGNHDNSYDPASGFVGHGGYGHWYEAGDAEVAYAHRNDRLSDKWHMPDRYYSFVAGDVTFVALDTNTLMFHGMAFPPTDVTYQEQEAFVDEALGAADTPWRIVFGHHPYISNGQHGDAGSYDGDTPPLDGPYVQQFYEEHVCGKADLLLAGHDHDLQWLTPAASCPGAQQIISGAAGKTRSLGDPERNEAYFQQGDTYGFLWAEVDGDTFTGAFYDSDGDLLFERDLVRTLTA